MPRSFEGSYTSTIHCLKDRPPILPGIESESSLFSTVFQNDWEYSAPPSNLFSVNRFTHDHALRQNHLQKGGGSSSRSYPRGRIWSRWCWGIPDAISFPRNPPPPCRADCFHFLSSLLFFLQKSSRLMTISRIDSVRIEGGLKSELAFCSDELTFQLHLHLWLRFPPLNGEWNLCQVWLLARCLDLQRQSTHRDQGGEWVHVQRIHTAICHRKIEFFP